MFLLVTAVAAIAGQATISEYQQLYTVGKVDRSYSNKQITLILFFSFKKKKCESKDKKMVSLKAAVLFIYSCNLF
jgi:hypothetical protein